ncbi:SpoIIIAH-like family protein [Paenibacillus sp. sgz500992]|uniref:SpoIIIAH-like family protein n=1 Tax=Paenibacillus sp. sgz500992 TaxID=3242476 RepID=UPI0036D38550
MKGKRQTIWLVSMLSLMVVLSAYYLFTEDSGASVPQETAGSIQVDNLKETGANSSVLDNGLVINEVDTKDAVTADAGTKGTADDNTAVTADDSTDDSTVTAKGDNDDTAVKDDSTLPANAKGEDTDKTAAAKDDKSSDSKTAAADKDTAAASTEKTPVKGDDEILDEVASQSVSASSLFNNYLYEREQQNLKNYNDLLALINDMDKTPAENAVAHEQLNKLEEKETKITGIEEQLQKKYGEAIVKEESGDAYTVVVLSEKLDVKQAVGIVDLVMKELSVSQDKIRVQYVSEQ